MVAIERRKLAETEDELKETQAEREALRNALRLVSAQQNAANEGSTNAIPDASLSSQTSTHVQEGSTSSAVAKQSPPTAKPRRVEDERTSGGK